jgi:hypothetical protein
VNRRFAHNLKTGSNLRRTVMKKKQVKKTAEGIKVKSAMKAGILSK